MIGLTTQSFIKSQAIKEYNNMEIPSFVTEHPGMVILAVVAVGYALYKIKSEVM